MKARLFATTTVLLLLLGGARAQDCQTSSPEVDTGPTPVGQYYVDNDPCQPGCIFSIWIYKESNGREGLQRGDQVCNDDGSCCTEESDTIIF